MTELQLEINKILEQLNVDLWDISSKATGQSVKPAEYDRKKEEVLSKTRVKLGKVVHKQLQADGIQGSGKSLAKIFGGAADTKDYGKEIEDFDKVDTKWPPPLDEPTD